MKCFYHGSDLDGYCSGAIVKYFRPICELYPIDYGQNFPWEEIEDGEEVYMVDFSLQPFEDMKRLNDLCKLIWIDHHKSAIEACEEEKYTSIHGIRRIGIGACALVWEYFTIAETPYAVKLLAEYDVWNHSNPDTLPFQYGCRLYNTNPSSEEGMKFWREFFNSEDNINVKALVAEGKICLRYEEQINRKYCERYVFETELEGLKAIAVNKGISNSKLFKGFYDPRKHDIMITFCYLGDKWTVSLYSDKKGIDVSIIARKYGGGGHKGAAGFQCKELPFI